MRKNHLELRIVGLTLIIAVVTIVAMYLWINRGLTLKSMQQWTASNSNGPTMHTGLQTETGTPSQTAGSTKTLPASETSKQIGLSTNAQSPIQAPIEEGQPQETATDGAKGAVADSAKEPGKIENTKIVAVGDSFTYGNPVGPDKSWTTWAAQNSGFEIINHGRVGQTSKDVLAHFDADVVAEKPGRVIIFVGDGDAIKGVSPEDYQVSIKLMVAKARENNILPILALPLPYRGFEQRIKVMRDWLSSYAETEKIQSLDFAAVLFDSPGRFLRGLSVDGKYPTLQGYQVMGQCAAKLLDSE